MTDEEKAREVQQTLRESIDRILAASDEISMSVFAAFGLDIAKRAASTEMLELFRKSGNTYAEYTEGIRQYMIQLAHVVQEYSRNQTAQADKEEKEKRHFVN